MLTRFLVMALALLGSNKLLAAKHSLVLGVSGRPVDDVVKHLNTGDLSIRVQTFHTDDELYAALGDGRVDLAFMGAVRYVQAHYQFGANPLVADGNASRSMLVVPVSSPITRVSQLKGKRVAFGFPQSTSTYLVPLLVLSKNRMQEKDVKGSFVGQEPQAQVDEMLAGKHDACAISEWTYVANKARLRVLEASDPFAGPPLVGRKGLSAAAGDEVRRMMATYKPPRAVPGQRFSNGAVPVTDADYNRIRFLLKVVLKQSYL